MARLRLNPPSTATRIDYGLVQPQDLNLATGATETKVPSYGVRQVEPPALKEMHINATPLQASKGISRTSRSQPISRLNAPVQTRLPISGLDHLAYTSDICGSLVRASDTGAALGTPDLHDGVLH